ncbi:MAG: hypothetical protein RL021_2216 [Bacteroidota bacterium]|jgi:GWxTD domain-containing protein
MFRRLSFLLLLVSPWIAATDASARLNAYFSYAAFDQPGGRPYLETYLQVTGTSVYFAPLPEGRYKGTIEVQWVFRKGDRIVTFDKYLLHGPELDSLGLLSPPDFLDVQRVPLDTGNYTVELSITDKHSDEQGFNVKQEISIRFPDNTVSISDIELLEKYSPAKSESKYAKSGYEVYPFVLGFYPQEVNRLLFYTEIYRTDRFAGGDVLVRYMISNHESKQLVNELVVNRKQSAASVIPLLAELPIDQLASGNYQLTVEVRSKENKLLAYRQCFFQRINIMRQPTRLEEIALVDANNTFAALYTNRDTVAEYISSLFPIFSQLEGQIAENQLRIGDLNSLQQFFYYFWSKRNPTDPQSAWNSYRLEVLKVNAAYSTLNRKGYETERGRVYLKYGPPNTIVKEIQDPESYPYEIWHYYRVNNQSNRRFVFYSTDLASNAFRLLHSDVRGEIQDPNWELKLHSRSQAFGADIDQDQSYDIYGSRTKENFRMPR